MPTRRNGRRRSQAIGYKMSARRARGQQKINKISQSINLINIDIFLTMSFFLCNLSISVGSSSGFPLPRE
jgi:hypothetical protein